MSRTELVRLLEQADEGLANAYSSTHNDYDKDRLACERIGLQKAIKIVKAAALEGDAQPVAVKALEWASERTGSMFSAEFYDIRREDGVFYLRLLDNILSTHATSGAAKTAAQADYEKRIRSALVATPPSPKLEVAIKALRDVTVHLVAARSLLSRSPKTAAASDRMFNMMLADYQKSIDRARKALSQLTEKEPSNGQE